VLYVGRNFRDYDGNDVTQGIPDPFVDSLTHDSIVVQIPLLKGQINNRLDKYLDIFCQDRRDKNNSQILTVDEALMEDEDMRHIVTRLLSAASDTQVRHNMNIEEEINTALENRDTEIMLYKKKASDAERKASYAEKKASDAEKKASDAEKKASDAEKKASDAERKVSDAEKKASDAERKASDAERTIAEQTMQLSKQSEQLLSAVKLLRDSGMSDDRIASSLGISIDDAMKIL
jgi:chromosome segregation ATPase